MVSRELSEHSRRREVRLAADTIDNKDIDDLCTWLKTASQLTQGPLTVEFQRKFSLTVGKKHSVFVNSGSSAILLLLYAMKVRYPQLEHKVVVPAVSWATDLAPVIQLGMKPILVDCNLENLCSSLEHLEEIFEKEKPWVYIHVHVLGLPNPIEEVSKLCDKYNVLLIEDCCETMSCDGLSYADNVNQHYYSNHGSYGVASVYSFHFNHFMSTIEGGMITTDGGSLAEKLLMMRNHGWTRNLPIESRNKQVLKGRYKTSDFREQYTFYYPGFNLRGTDLQAKIGLGQLKKLPMYLKRRNEIFYRYKKGLKNTGFDFKENSPAFAYPVLNEDVEMLWRRLGEEGIESRPLIAGSMGRQPFWIRYNGGPTELPNADKVHEQGLYLPIHSGMSNEDVDYVIEVFNRLV